MSSLKPIDLEWLKKYIDDLLDNAKKLPAGKFRDAVVLRAEHAIDLVEAWKAHQK